MPHDPDLGEQVSHATGSGRREPRLTGAWRSREAIEARGAQLHYLPPYSPDLNPIEQVFAKLKALLRTAATRTVDALWHAIAQSLDAFSATECNNYLVHSG